MFLIKISDATIFYLHYRFFLNLLGLHVHIDTFLKKIIDSCDAEKSSVSGGPLYDHGVPIV